MGLALGLQSTPNRAASPQNDKLCRGLLHHVVAINAGTEAIRNDVRRDEPHLLVEPESVLRSAEMLFEFRELIVHLFDTNSREEPTDALTVQLAIDHAPRQPDVILFRVVVDSTAGDDSSIEFNNLVRRAILFVEPIGEHASLFLREVLRIVAVEDRKARFAIIARVLARLELGWGDHGESRFRSCWIVQRV